jgi:DNA-binding response OmpR family regulator
VRVLIVEDEEKLAELIRLNLHRAGYASDVAGTVEEARAVLAATHYDVILLDLGLPDEDGFAILRLARGAGHGKSALGTPVIIVTARDGVAERVRGLNSGADDYLTKPFAFEELTARIGAVLRRPGNILGIRLECGNLVFESVTRSVTVEGIPLAVPRRELAVLETLLRRVGHVVTRGTLEDAVYAFGEETESNALEAHVSRLRKRLAEAGATVTIHVVRGVGYLVKANAPKNTMLSSSLSPFSSSEGA